MVEIIKELCNKQGISVLQLERELGIAHGIHRWDVNKPSIDKVQRVADYFGVSIDYLVSDEDEEESEIDRAKQRLFDENPGFRILFDATEGCPEEELYRAAAIVRALKEQSNKH